MTSNNAQACCAQILPAAVAALYFAEMILAFARLPIASSAAGMNAPGVSQLQQTVQLTSNAYVPHPKPACESRQLPTGNALIPMRFSFTGLFVNGCVNSRTWSMFRRSKDSNDPGTRLLWRFKKGSARAEPSFEVRYCASIGRRRKSVSTMV